MKEEGYRGLTIKSSTYKKLLDVVHELEGLAGHRVSLSDAILCLIENWEATPQEEKERLAAFLPRKTAGRPSGPGGGTSEEGAGRE